MKTPSRKHLLPLLSDDLDPVEKSRLMEEIAHSPALQTQWEEIQTIQELLRDSTPQETTTALKPFFTDRVMRHLKQKSTPAELLYGSLWHLFRPIAVTCLLLIMALATYSVSFVDAYEVQPTTTEAVLGLEPVTLTAAYTADMEIFPVLDP